MILQKLLVAMFSKIKVEITRLVLDHNPNIVECRLVDALGHEHFFNEKVPIVTLENLDANSRYPRHGVVACQIIEKKLVDNREVFRVNTDEPWHIESTIGEVEFDVFPEQLLESFEDW